MYIHLHTWNSHDIYNASVHRRMYLIVTFISSFVVCRTPSLLSLLILTALRRIPMMFRWKTVGMLVPSFFLLVICVQRVGDPQRIQSTDAAQRMAGVAARCMR